MGLVNFETALWAGGLATVMAVVMSVVLVKRHLTHLVSPKHQLRMIAIVGMVPLFAIDSFIGLADIEGGETFFMVLDSIKECYEAFVIHSFLELMFAHMNIVRGKPVPKHLEGRHVHHSFPVNLFYGDMHLDSKLVDKLYTWTMQFVVLRPVISVIELYLEMAGRLDEYQLYFTIILNVSVSTAVYALVAFYHAFEKDLAPHRPLAQFLCIKGVVFFAFWQGVILELCVWRGWLHAGHWYSTTQIETAVQNLLVCIEMGLLFSFANAYAFTAEPYVALAKKVHKE